jgi:hypothetical protein
MSIFDIANLGMFLLLGPAVVLAQTDAAAAGIAPSLIQLGAIGVILAWLTMVDIPARNKAAADREVVWQKQVEAERAASTTREAQFQVALERHADALAKVGETQEHLADAVTGLTNELREERTGHRS